MGSLEKRLEKLEAAANPSGVVDLSEWPLEDQLEEVLWALKVHRWGRSVQEATDRELELLETLIAQGVVPEGARAYFERMDPQKQPERERWLYEQRQWSKRWREEAPKREEERRRFVEESKRRDRELLERNRASVGLPPHSL